MLARHMLWSSHVCPSVCLFQAGVPAKRLDELSWCLAHRPLILNGIQISSIVRALTLEPWHSKLETWTFYSVFRHGKSTLASVVNVIRPSRVHHTERSASTVVYNTMSATWSVARFFCNSWHLPAVWRCSVGVDLFAVDMRNPSQLI